MKTKTIATLFTILPALTFADIVDFGAHTKPLDASTASAFELPADSGLIVTEIFANTPAAKLALERKDILTHINGQPLHTTTPLSRFITESYKSGDEIQVIWIRDTTPMTGKVTLDTTSSFSEFNERYPNDLVDISIKKIGEYKREVQSTVIRSGEDIPEHIEKLLNNANINLEDLTKGHPGTLVSTSTRLHIAHPNGDVTVGNATDENKRQVIINDNSGALLLDEMISKDQIKTKVPSKFQTIVELAFSGIIVGKGNPSDNEE